MARKRVDEIRLILNKKRFTNELKYLTENSTDKDEEVNDRILKLTKIVKNLENQKKDSKKNLKEEYFDEISRYVFRQEWKKLTPFHQNIKMNEYINSLVPEINKNKKEIITKLSKLINDKKLNKKDQVKYNPKEEKIESISILIKNDETYDIKN